MTKSVGKEINFNHNGSKLYLSSPLYLKRAGFAKANNKLAAITILTFLGREVITARQYLCFFRWLVVKITFISLMDYGIIFLHYINARHLSYSKIINYLVLIQQNHYN